MDLCTLRADGPARHNAFPPRVVLRREPGVAASAALAVDREAFRQRYITHSFVGSDPAPLRGESSAEPDRAEGH